MTFSELEKYVAHADALRKTDPSVVDLRDVPPKLIRLLARVYQKEMSVTVIKGIPQSGKTNTALLFAEILRAMGVVNEFATNSPILPCVTWIKKVEALNTLTLWGYSNPKKKLFVYDELIESSTNRRAMSELNVAWVKNLGQISHQSMHILAIVQEEQGGKKFYESAFLDPAYLRGVWIKETRQTAIFKSRFYDEYKDGFRLTTIPKTKVPYDKHVHAFFQLTATTALDQINLLPLTMQVAVLYSKPEIGYDEIQKQCSLPHKKQVQREIKKALRLLLQTEAGRSALAQVSLSKNSAGPDVDEDKPEKKAVA